ncbi:hypothetical protein LCGC14_1614410 [marine sediment metagenome]|uniref:Uncharacterized protein n=1 Tax=marine sediment metagenome TaxID=412755 RepID=A0A0F9I7E4_9ZZZZ
MQDTYTVTMGVRGASRIRTEDHMGRDSAEFRAAQWRRNNGQGSYWAKVTKTTS